MSADDKGRVDWRALATDASRYGRAGAGIVAQRAREREAELLSDLAAAIAAEREAAAKVCDEHAAWHHADMERVPVNEQPGVAGRWAEATSLAAAIRARGAS